MRRSTYLITLVLAAGLTWGMAPVLAEECFVSTKSLNEDAQNLRLKALDMGWEVGKTASFTAAGLVTGKTTLYPKDPVDICLKAEDGKLLARVQSRSRDAGQAEWHDLYASKK